VTYLFPVSVAQQQQRRAAGQKKSARQTAITKPVKGISLGFEVELVDRVIVRPAIAGQKGMENPSRWIFTYQS
jgi:hypothetical protein